MKGNALLKEVVNARVSWLRKAYRKARWKKRYTRWYKHDSEEELRSVIREFQLGKKRRK